jgi:hypothetical protein
VCLVKPSATAIILSSVFIGLNNFFSGLIVLPQLMVGFYAVPYYLAPGHYVYEGLIVSLFGDDNRVVLATPGDSFQLWLQEQDLCVATSSSNTCDGTVSLYIQYFFDNNFTDDHNVRNAIILGLILVFARVFTFVCLRFIKFSS